MGNSRTLRRRVSDRRPIWLTPEVQEDLYFRWRELMVVVKRRDAMLVAHPKWQGLYNDFMERLVEDEYWTLKVSLQRDPRPVMLFRIEVPEDDLLVWPGQGQKLLKPSEFIGDVGLGRVGWAAPREGGPQPWETAKVPKGKQKIITPDSPDEAA